MYIKTIIISLLLFFGSNLVMASPSDTIYEIDTVAWEEIKTIKKRAIILTPLLGVFGMHRMELGTKIKTPIFYTLTLGGGFGLLPLIDLVVILSANDPRKFKNNNQLIMWL